MRIRHSIRATRDFNKACINHLLEEFSPKWVEKFNVSFPNHSIKTIEFGKQDSRGAPSITLVDENFCVPHEKHFSNNAEMLAFIKGFLAASHNRI